MTDQELLTALLESDQLTEEEELAFTDIESKCKRFGGTVTAKQRAWIWQVAARIGIDPGSQNLVSTGQVKVTDEERASLQGFLGTLKKLLVPPHRRPK